MPANKNALVRYRYLDELLSSRVKYYTRQELTDKLNEHLAKPVGKRCVEKDLIDIQDEWGIEYEERIFDGKKYICDHGDDRRAGRRTGVRVLETI